LVEDVQGSKLSEAKSRKAGFKNVILGSSIMQRLTGLLLGSKFKKVILGSCMMLRSVRYFHLSSISRSGTPFIGAS
jgi:hypothetical protein